MKPEDLAPIVWTKMYPDRRPFDQIDPSAQADWILVVSITIDEYFSGMKRGIDPMKIPLA